MLIKTKKTIKSILPEAIAIPLRRLFVSLSRQRNGRETTKDVFTKIYQENIWGGERGKFFSGGGSSEEQATVYSSMIKALIAEKAITSIVDLGCGDFTVGSKLVEANVSYIGVDIVDALIQHHQAKYARPQVSFVALDIITDPLPDGELCLIRQVLQHLSNSQIADILKKLSKYKYVVITEHYPDKSVTLTPNLDKPHGADTRSRDNSAIVLDLPPFNVKNPVLIGEVQVKGRENSKGYYLRSYLIQQS